jgi:hypothetical protein
MLEKETCTTRILFPACSHARCLARHSCDISCIFPRLLSSERSLCGVRPPSERAMARLIVWLLLLQADSLCVTIARSVCACYQLRVFRFTCRPDSFCMHVVSKLLHLSSMACPCKLSSSYVYTSGGPGWMGSQRRR